MGCCNSTATADGAYEPSPFTKFAAVKQTTDYKESAPSKKHSGNYKVLVVCTDEGRFEMANGKVFSSGECEGKPARGNCARAPVLPLTFALPPDRNLTRAPVLLRSLLVSSLLYSSHTRSAARPGNHPTEVYLPLLHFKAAGFSFEFATASGGPVALEMWAFPAKDRHVSALHEELKPLLASPTALASVDPALKGYAGIFLPGGHGAMVNLPSCGALGNLLRAAHELSLPTIALCHGPAALLAGREGGEFPYKGYKAVSFSDKTDKFTPSIGYIPGPLPWLQQEALRKEGMLVANESEKGEIVVDRELVTGDSPLAANGIGLRAAPMLVEAADSAANSM